MSLANTKGKKESLHRKRVLFGEILILYSEPYLYGSAIYINPFNTYFNPKIMAEQNNSGAWLGVGLGLGVFIGSLFTYIILKGQQSQPPPQTLTMQPQYPQPYQPPAINVYPIMKEEWKPTTGIQTQVVPSAPPAVPVEITAYKNNEHWEIERSKDGAIKGINVVRDVKADVTGA